MSEFNMPPGVSTNDIPGNEATPPGIPPVFVEAAKEAGGAKWEGIFEVDPPDDDDCPTCTKCGEDFDGERWYDSDEFMHLCRGCALTGETEGEKE